MPAEPRGLGVMSKAPGGGHDGGGRSPAGTTDDRPDATRIVSHAVRSVKTAVESSGTLQTRGIMW